MALRPPVAARWTGTLDSKRARLGAAAARRPIAAALLALALILCGSPARAWVEVHVTGDDARVVVDRSGAARVEHRIAIKIAGGPLKSFDLEGIDEDAVPDPDGYVVPARDAAASSLENAIPVAAELARGASRPADGTGAIDGPAPRGATLRLRFADPGLRRGVYVVMVRYATQLAARGLVTPDGAMTRLRWKGPVFPDGLESARTTFVLPPAPNEPRADEDEAVEPGAPIPPTFLSTVRRTPERDEIELLRPYAPKGEPITWSARVDPRALRPAEAARPPAAGPAPAGPALLAPARRTLALGGAGAVFLFYAIVVAWKARQVARHARAAGVEPRPLVPIPLALRAVLAGLALAAGLGLELALKSGTAGAALVLAAVALAAHRPPRPRGRALRGPGRWLPISEAEAFRPAPRPAGASLDVGTRGGKLWLAVSLAALAAAVVAVARASTYHAMLLALDVPAILVIFGTGSIAELPPDGAAAPAPLLREVARRLRRLLGPADARLVPRVRVPDGQPDADELRLTVVPRAPLKGFVAIEIGATFALGPGARVALPEVLLRVTAGSDCERAVAHLTRFGRALRGRRPDERVVAMSPRLPTASMTAAIAAALVARVTDRARLASMLGDAPPPAPKASARPAPKPPEPKRARRPRKPARSDQAA